ncbi:unnamed protein product [Staurois parvus]|uniref:Uncharacterized protein n=1 Tax=Staurois parvus TaxID=386267 RepID=A0ABN9H008_9NEOB|nr:unnamed protein product [Staurois parvus]
MGPLCPCPNSKKPMKKYTLFFSTIWTCPCNQFSIHEQTLWSMPIDLRPGAD